jgi:3-oxoacyl-[acyl-carrier-protein] synthase-3
MMLGSRIIGVGSYLPQNVLTNSDLEDMVDTTSEWIIERTGIEERRIADKDEFTSDLALNASLSAISDAGIDKNEIDMIVVATTTPDRTFPATATILQNKIGILGGFAFDVQAVCSGFLYAMNIADNFIKSGQVKTALVVGAETLSRIVDWTDRNTCVLFGDGAGAIILRGVTDKKHCIVNTILHSDGSYVDILNTNGGISYNQRTGYIYMEGNKVFKLAVNKISENVLENLKICNMTTNDISLLISHQANKRIIDGVMDKLKLPVEKTPITVDKYGNTSAASIPLTLDYAIRKKLIKDGDIIVFDALGGGLTWGSSIVKW